MKMESDEKDVQLQEKSQEIEEQAQANQSLVEERQ